MPSSPLLPAGFFQTETLEAWLAERVGAELEIDPAELDPTDAFAAYGLESLGAVAVVGQLEALMGVELPETLLWDYPSIRQLAAHLRETYEGR